MLDSLALLVIAFIIMSVISVIGVALIFLVKNQKVRKGLLYFLSIWGMIIAYCGVRSTPLYMSDRILFTIGLGTLAVIALFIYLFVKKEKSFNIARILTCVSVVAGMINCFMF